MKRFYVGHQGGKRFFFSSETTPTRATHGDKYNAVVGPFRTKRAAMWASATAPNNPHYQHVNDAERISKQAAR